MSLISKDELIPINQFTLFLERFGLTLNVLILLSLRIFTRTSLPPDLSISFLMSPQKMTGILLISRILSPGFIPPCDAGLASITEPIIGFKGGKIPSSYKRFEGSLELSQLFIGR